MKTKTLFQSFTKNLGRFKKYCLLIITHIVLLAFLNLLSGCYYFRVVSEEGITEQRISDMKQEDKYVVLQRGNEAWHLYDYTLADDTLTGKLDIFLGIHTNYLDPKLEGLNTIKKGDNEVLESVHLHTSDTSFVYMDTVVIIPSMAIQKVYVYEYAQSESRSSMVLPAVFGGIIVAGIALLFAANILGDVRDGTDQ